MTGQDLEGAGWLWSALVNDEVQTLDHNIQEVEENSYFFFMGLCCVHYCHFVSAGLAFVIALSVTDT
jgi:hypothetical protein